MSFNGSGVFLIDTAGQPVVDGTIIDATAFNALTADLAAGLSNCVTKDGQTPISADLDLEGYKIVDVGAPTALTDGMTNSFTQAGTGAQARVIQSKLRDIVNVRDFKNTDLTQVAWSDGLQDDTTGTTAALATGADVYFPTGSGRITANIILANAGQTLRGNGPQSIVACADGTFNVFTVRANNVTIRDMRINGGATSDATEQWAVFTAAANPADYLKVHNVVFSGAISGVGLNNGVKYDTDCDYGEVTGCQFDRLMGSISGTGYGVLAGYLVGLKCTLNNGLGSVGRGRHLIYFSGGCSDSVCAHNRCVAFNEEAFTQFSQGVQPACSRNIFACNSAVNCSANGTAAGSAIGVYGHSIDAKIIGNQITGSGSNGIAVDGTSVIDLRGTQVENNAIRNSQRVGIIFTCAVGFSCNGNTIAESSLVSASVHSNIDIRSDGTTASSDGIIEGNRSTGPLFTRYPLVFNPTVPTPVNVIVGTNNFPTCAGGEAQYLESFADGDTTPYVGSGIGVFKTSNTAPTTITDFDGGQNLTKITILFNDTNTTLSDAVNLVLAGAFTGTAGDVITLVKSAGAWYEQSRSVN